MLIQKSEENIIERFIDRFYDSINSVIDQTYETTKPSLSFYFIETLIFALFELSIVLQKVFSQPVWAQSTIGSTTSVIGYLDPTNYMDINSFIFLIVNVVIMAMMFCNFAIFVLIVAKISRQKWLMLTSNRTLRIFKVFSVPIARILIFGLTNPNSQYPMGLNFLSMFILFCFVVNTAVHIKYYFDITTPATNVNFKYTTSYFFYGYLICMLKFVIIYVVSMRPVNYLIVCIIMDHWKTRYMFISVNPKTKYLEQFVNRFSVMTYWLLLCNEIFEIPEIILSIWIFTSLVFVINFLIGSKYADDFEVTIFNDCQQINEQKLVILCQKLQNLTDPNKKDYLYNLLLEEHTNHCNYEFCYLKSNRQGFDLQGRVTQRQIELFIDEFLKIRSRESQLFRLMYLLRLFKTHQCQLENQQLLKIKNTFLSKQYQPSAYRIGYLIEKEKLNENYEVTEENYEQTKILFFSKLKSTLKIMMSMMRIIKEKHIVLKHLETEGIQVYDQLNELTFLFCKLLKTDRIDYKIVEYYLLFLVQILNNQQLADDLILKIKRKEKKLGYNFFLNQSYLPTVQISSKHNPTIVDMNIEALKLFVNNKIQYQNKNVFDFIIPKITNPAECFEELQQSSRFCIVNYQDLLYTPVKMKVRIKIEPNMKHIYIELIPYPIYANQSLIILDANLDIVFCYRKLLQGQDIIDIEYIYELKVKPELNKVKKSMEIVHDVYSMTVRIEQTIHNQYKCVFIEVDRHRSELLNVVTTSEVKTGTQSPLFFTIGKETNQKITYYGEKSDQDNDFKISKGSLFENRSVLKEKKDYSKEIALYRLDKSEIQNIEFREPQGEELQDNHVYFINNKDEYVNIRIWFKLHIVALIVLLVCLFGIIVSGRIISLQYYQRTNEMISKINNIIAFEVGFYRQLGIMRDGYLGLNTSLNWITELNKLTSGYNSNSTQHNLFSQNIINQYLLIDTYYNTTLDQIISIFSAKLTVMLATNNLTFAVPLFMGAITIKQLIAQEKTDLINNAYIMISSEKMYQLYNIVIQACLVFSFVGVLLAIDFYVKKQKELFVMKYRLMEDNEIDNVILQLEKLDFLLIQLEKNSEMESIQEQNITYKKRQNPRIIRSSIYQSTELIISGMVLILFVISIILYVTFTSISTSDQITNSFTFNLGLKDLYNNFMKLALVKLVHKTDPATLNTLINSLFNMRSLPVESIFSSGYQTFLTTMFFGPSCPYLQQRLGSTFTCTNYANGFNIENPFGQGLLYYFHEELFQISDNITETYPLTGILGYPFALIFGDIIRMQSSEWNTLMQSKVAQKNIFFVLQIIMFLFAVFFAIIRISHARQALINLGRISSIFVEQAKKDEVQVSIHENLIKVDQTE